MRRVTGVGIVSILALAANGCTDTESFTLTTDGNTRSLPLLVELDFDTPVPDRWEPTDPDAWAFTTDGERTVYAMVSKSDYKPPYRAPEGMSILEDVVVSDFVLDAWVRSTTDNYGHRDMCIFFGYQDPAHFYYVHFGLKSDQSSNTVHIVNDAPRSPIVRDRTDGTPWTEGYHHVRVIRDAGTARIEAYFDDMKTPAMTAEDKTFTYGRVGLGSFDDTGMIDRIKLWGKRVAPTTSTEPK